MQRLYSIVGLQMTISENALNCKPEFAHWDSYSRFARYVSTVNRYILNEEQRTFLDTVLATIKGRDGELKEGHVFYRAQRGMESM